MRRIAKWLSPAILGIAVLLTGCGGGKDDNNTPQPDDSAHISSSSSSSSSGSSSGGQSAALMLQGSVAIIGQGSYLPAAAEGATVRVMDANGTRELARSTVDQDGEVNIADNIPADENIVIKISHDRTAEQILRLHTLTSGSQRFMASLLPKGTAITAADFEKGGVYSGPQGSKVIVAPNSFIDTVTGQTVSGSVQISVTPLNVGTLPKAFPGTVYHERNGQPAIMVSGGMAEFKFTQNGHPLNLAPGKTAAIEIPLYIEKDPDGNTLKPGSTVPMWYMSDATGLWTEEGTGIVMANTDSPTGYTVQAQVKHFTWWNIDYSMAMLSVALEFYDQRGQPFSSPEALEITAQFSVIDSRGAQAKGGSTLYPGSNHMNIQVPVRASMDITATGMESQYQYGSASFSASQILDAYYNNKPLKMTLNTVGGPIIELYAPTANIELYPAGSPKRDRVSFYLDFRYSVKLARMESITWILEPVPGTQGCPANKLGRLDPTTTYYYAPAREDIPDGGCAVRIKVKSRLFPESESGYLTIHLNKPPVGTGLYPYSERFNMTGVETENYIDMLKENHPNLSFVPGAYPNTVIPYFDDGGQDSFSAWSDELITQQRHDVVWSIYCLQLPGSTCTPEKTLTIDEDGTVHVPHGSEDDVYVVRVTAKNNPLEFKEVMYTSRFPW